ncbi:hypothetical protein [Sulfurimonas sp. HSL-1716]|uniref:hypothetical protein n=1 Tax=Hydrocurvibacter sulfurireducens TaxID=3131937 RepID=UPI0031F8C3AC
MICMSRAAAEIQTVGLYDLIFQDVQKIAGKQDLSESEVLRIIEENPAILEEYKQINVEYNLSNIHLRDILPGEMDESFLKEAQAINKNLNTLRKLEKYTLDFEQSSTLIIIFSVEFFVLFSVQYFIVLLNLKEWQLEIYGVFALSIFIAWRYAQKEKRKYFKNNNIFQKVYDETLKMLNVLQTKGCIDISDMTIRECQEHV